jgi:flagellar FliL protein
MAKKPKKEPQTEGAGDSAEATPAGGGRKKKLLIGGLAILLFGGGAGGYLLFAREHKAEQGHVEVKKPISFVDLREMTVNLAAEPNADRQRFLKFRVALEVGDPKVASDIQPLMPRVEDTFQVFVRELRASDLEGSAGAYRLREELLRRVNIAVYPAKVDAVLFKDIVVQ